MQTPIVRDFVESPIDSGLTLAIVGLMAREAYKLTEGAPIAMDKPWLAPAAFLAALIAATFAVAAGRNALLDRNIIS